MFDLSPAQILVFIIIMCGLWRLVSWFIYINHPDVVDTRLFFRPRE